MSAVTEPKPLEAARGFAGPRSWAVSAGVGLLAGFLLALSAPTAGHDAGVALWLCVPFAALLASIAVVPLVWPRFWHGQYPGVALFLGGLVLAYYLQAFGAGGRHEMLHAGVEYFSFIALVGGLYVASGGILVDIRDRASPVRNTALLAVGAVLANVVGTTGASVLLIRPFMRMNRGRLRPVHVAMFIFIVSNCGGCLTPIGDPPLYLGYLKGVPFFWTLTHLWPMWALVNGVLLGVFFVIDGRIPAAQGVDGAHAPVFDPSNRTPLVASSPAIVCLVLLVAGVFIDPLLARQTDGRFEGYPVGAAFQVLMAALAYRLSPASIRRANHFTFEPVKEVGFLFAGIFLTMVPALGYLRLHAGELGLTTPTRYYFTTGGLSGVLDNAPTYVSFLQVALGTFHLPLDGPGIAGLLARPDGQRLLEGISLGAVFFGAMTYIGNGPNFMVRAIVDGAFERGQRQGAAPGEKVLGVRMPGFVGYVGYAAAILLPVLVLNWVVFLR